MTIWINNLYSVIIIEKIPFSFSSLQLNDVKVGGETAFYHLNVAAEPEKGSALVWFNLKRSGLTNMLSGHGACPVLYGHKWSKHFTAFLLLLKISTQRTYFIMNCGLMIEIGRRQSDRKRRLKGNGVILTVEVGSCKETMEVSNELAIDKPWETLLLVSLFSPVVYKNQRFQPIESFIFRFVSFVYSICVSSLIISSLTLKESSCQKLVWNI